MKQTKSADRILQMIIIALLFVIVLMPIQKAGLITNIGQEDIYWERARFLLGQGGATIYDGSSLSSLGYSLILVPICVLIKSPYGAYKAAFLLNGLFLCASYVMSLVTVRRLFPTIKNCVTTAVCLLAAVSPVLFTEKLFTGPGMITMFLTWSCLYLLTGVWQGGGRRFRAALAGCLILIGFFQISLLGVILGFLAALGLAVCQKKLDETSFLGVVLAVLLGLAAGNVAERVVLYRFAKDLDITVLSSLEVLFNGIRAGWEKDYLAGLFEGLTGKLYSMMINTAMLILPGILYLIQMAVRWKKGSGKDEKEGIFAGFLFVFVLQTLFVVLYDHSRSLGVGLTSLQGLAPVLIPAAVIGMIQMAENKTTAEELAVCLLILCGCTFVTANAYQTAGVTEVSGINSGLLALFVGEDVQAVSAVYMAACLILLAAITSWACLSSEIRKKGLQRLLRLIPVLLAVLVCVISFYSVFRQTTGKMYRNSMRDVASVASVLGETAEGTEFFYLGGSASDETIVILQSLIPEKEIRIIPDDQKEREKIYKEIRENPKKTVLLTGCEESWTEEIGEEKLPSYRINYMTRRLAVWTDPDDETHEAVEAAVTKLLENPGRKKVELEEEEPDFVSEEIETESGSETEAASETGEDTLQTETEADSTESTESESTSPEEQDDLANEPGKNKIRTYTISYGGTILLAPGTYRLEIYFKDTEKTEDLSGNVTVSDAQGTLAETAFDQNHFSEDGTGAVGVEFSSREVMRNVTIEIRAEASQFGNVENIYYWKVTGAYEEGMNETAAVDEVCTLVQTLDEMTGTTGQIVYVDDRAKDSRDLSVRSFQGQLESYKISAVVKEELPDVKAEYLVGDTKDHAYFSAMDRYSIICRDGQYTVLVRNDSAQYQVYAEANGETLSQNREIRIAAFTSKDPEEIKKIALESGNYKYHLRIGYQEEALLGSGEAVAGTVYISDGTDTVGQLTIKNQDLLAGTDGTAEVAVPFTLRMDSKNVRVRIETEATGTLTMEPVSIELVTEDFRYGEEESMLPPLLNLVNRMGEKMNFFLVLTDESVENGQYDDGYLREQLPESRVSTITYEQAYDLTTDALLLTRGLRSEYLKLAEKYTIIGHAGKYTLWARSDGESLVKAIAAGAAVQSSGKKISPASLKAAGDIEIDSENRMISELPKGKYNITLKLTAEDELDLDDKVEVTLLRDKSETEIEKEVEAMMEDGLTREEAMSDIELQADCGSATLEACEFDGDGSLIVTLETSGTRKLENLTFDVYSWHGGKVVGEIVWTEIV